MHSAGPTFDPRPQAYRRGGPAHAAGHKAEQAYACGPSKAQLAWPPSMARSLGRAPRLGGATTGQGGKVGAYTK
jgi:hypothetical protein